ncbi:Patatin-like phospholipase [Rhizoctonia solani]|uniref:Patatin-like phospholipase n=1 Tax=Rhizoctonia solani TaxID=456999 RepID=A0A8H7IIS0_9AGAM|nr:Patatin-like phospholipase [Rhizoctonia solani]
MLGRLRMPINVAIERYIQLTEKVLCETKYSWQHGIFKATLFEQAIKEIVRDYSESKDEETRLLDIRPDSCKVFVCAMAAANMRASIPTHFRTFTAYENVSANCKIWEAVRATSAHPIFFKRIKIQDIGLQVNYIGGEIGCNNPTWRVLTEANRGAIKVPEPGLKENMIPLGTLDTLKQIATDCETMQEKMAAKFERFKRPVPDPGVYFRFNLDQVPEDTQQWGVVDNLNECTKQYMEMSENSQLAEGTAAAIRRREPRVLLSEAARDQHTLALLVVNFIGNFMYSLGFSNCS